MKKRLLCLLLVLLLAVGLMAVAAAENSADTAYEGLMFKTLNWRNGVPTENDWMGSFARGDDNPLPNRGHSVNLYYGTEESYIPLTGGTVTSSNPEVATVELVTENGVAFYEIRGHAFGATTLTYSDGINTYVTDMTVKLPAWSEFYSARERSEETWLDEPVYDPVEGTTFWCMSKEGFWYDEIQGMSFEVEYEPFGTVTAVKRDETVADEDARYDIKIELPAGADFGVRNPYIRLIYRNGNNWNGGGMTIKQQPGLMFKTLYWQNGTPMENDYLCSFASGEDAPLPDRSYSVNLYYGTEESYVPLEGGTLTSSNPDVATVELVTENGVTYYEIRGHAFGTTVLTYSDGTNTYTAEMTVALPRWSEFYSARERSEETWLDEPVYDPVEGTTFWCMSKEGFWYDEIQGMSFEVEYEPFGTVTAVKRDETVADEEARYDIKIELPAGADFGVRNPYIRLIYRNGNNWNGGGMTIKQQPGLMYKTLHWQGSILVEDDYLFSVSSADDSPMPGYNYQVKLYYGTEESCVPLEGGTLTSSNPDVVTAERLTENGVTYYDLRGCSFGTTVLTYSDGTNTYTAEMTVALPRWGEFYSVRERSEETWLSDPVYNSETGTTLWFMSREGFDYEETLGLSFEVEYEPFGTVTAVKRDESAADEAARYDFKVELPAGKEFDGSRPYIRLYYRSGRNWTGGSLQMIYPPSLLYRHMNGYINAMEENKGTPNWVRQANFTVGSTWYIRLYHGTPDSFESLNTQDVTITSADPEILQVEKIIDRAQDGQPFYCIETIHTGTTTLTYTCGGETYAQEVKVTLMNPGLFTDRVRSEETMLAWEGPKPLSPIKDNIVWYLCEGGFAKEEIDSMSISLNEEPLPFEAVLRSDGNYDVKLDLSKGTLFISMSNYLRVDTNFGWNGFSFSVLGAAQSAEVVPYTVAFGFPNDNDPNLIDLATTDRNWRTGSSDKPSQNDSYTFFRQLSARAGTEYDEYWYLVDKAVTDSIRIKRIWISPTAGDAETFSFSEKSCVQELTGDGLSLDQDVYVREDLAGGAALCMDLQLTVGGETVDAVISVSMFQEHIEVITENRPENDTVEALNARLEELAEVARSRQSYTCFDVYLGSEYEGEIRIPDAFNSNNNDLNLYGAAGGTKVTGSIVMDPAVISMLENIYFVASEPNQTGISGGSILNMRWCTFQNYDIAIDATGGMATLTDGNVFVGNRIAVKLDCADGPANRNPWNNNTFINNGTAVQILHFDNWVTPYYMRIYDCNFFGNAVDFDIQEDAELYFYRNYFADWNTSRKNINLNALANANTHSAVFSCLSPRQAVVANTAANVTVNTTPYWFYPVQNWWSCEAKITDVFGDYDCLANAAGPALMEEEEIPTDEEPYENFLTVDWAQQTNLLSSMADDLELREEVFQTEGDKVITVLDDSEEPIGTWTFKESQQPALLSDGPATFNAGLTKVWEDGALLITVNDSDLLGKLAAYLSVPCGEELWSGVTVTGPDGKTVLPEWEDNTVTFSVTESGTYRIEKAAMVLKALDKAAHEILVAVNEKYAGKQVVLASYDANGKFLGFTAGKADETLTYDKDAAELGVFLVDALSTMVPQAEASSYYLQ